MQLWYPVIEETRAGHRSRSASPSDLAKAFPKFRGWSDAVRALDFPISPIPHKAMVDSLLRLGAADPHVFGQLGAKPQTRVD